jgi:hypothetical protein
MPDIENREPSYAQASKSARPIEAMPDPGYHIGKIDSRTLDVMDSYGLSIRNVKNQ